MNRGLPIRVRLENAAPTAKHGLLASLKDVAPLITGIGTLLLSVISFYYVRTQDRDKTEAAANEIRVKALAAANETDAAKQEVGAMTVAIYGKTALPVIRFLLTGSAANPNLRDFGVRVVRDWMGYESGPGRAEVLAEIASWARSGGDSLREGAYTALADLSSGLSRPEKATFKACFCRPYKKGLSPPIDRNRLRNPS